MALQRLADVDLGALRPAGGYRPSPTAWQDQVFYFLMVDRFSDNRETGYKDLTGNTVTNGSTPRFQAGDSGNAVGTEEAARKWREAGVSYCQGTLAGITTKLGYLKRLGITALWISPVFKQVAFQNSYHGYGV